MLILTFFNPPNETSKLNMEDSTDQKPGFNSSTSERMTNSDSSVGTEAKWDWKHRIQTHQARVFNV